MCGIKFEAASCTMTNSVRADGDIHGKAVKENVIRHRISFALSQSKEPKKQLNRSNGLDQETW